MNSQLRSGAALAPVLLLAFALPLNAQDAAEAPQSGSATTESQSDQAAGADPLGTAESARPTPSVPASSDEGSNEDKDDALVSRFALLSAPASPVALAPSAKATMDRFRDDEGFALHSIQLVEIPLVRNPVAIDQPSDNLWIKGPQPEARTLAKFTLSPSTEVTIALGIDEGVTLHQAEREPTHGVSPKAPDSLSTESALYCGNLPSGDDRIKTMPVCLHDLDEDGDFDRIAPAISESRSNDPLAISLMLPSLELAEPISYTPAVPDERTAMPIVMENCGKDWDRPRYRLLTDREEKMGGAADDLAAKIAADAGIPVEQVRVLLNRRIGMISKVGTSCTRGDELESFEGKTGKQIAKGTILASLNGIAVAIGRKKDGAPVTILGETGEPPHFRLESTALARASSGLSARQKLVATRQTFDKIPYMSAGPVRLVEGTQDGKEALFELPFQYGYRARLTEGTKIRTLLTSRSLEEGAEFYGVPMRRSLYTRTTYGGSVINSSTQRVGPPRGLDIVITWCTPVEEERKRRKGDEMESYFTYSATCFTQMGKQYSIVKDNSPGYAITSFRYSANISTNDGEPALQILESGTFGKPLTMRFYPVETVRDGVLRLTQEFREGGEYRGSTTIALTANSDGDYLYRNGSAQVKLTATNVVEDMVPQVTAEIVEAGEAGEQIVTNRSQR